MYIISKNIEIVQGYEKTIVYNFRNFRTFQFSPKLIGLIRKIENKMWELDELYSFVSSSFKIDDEKSRSIVNSLEQKEILIRIPNNEPEIIVDFNKNYDFKNISMVNFELLNSCNLSCPHCSLKAVPFESSNSCQLDFESIKLCLKLLMVYGLKEAFFTGGEPFLRKDLREILSYSRSLGLTTIVTSNGTLLIDDDVNFLIKNEIRVRISLYSDQKGYYEKFSRNFVEINALKERMLEMNAQLGFKKFECVIPIMNSNLDSIESRVSFCEENRIFYSFSIIKPFGRGLINWNKEKIPDLLREQLKKRYLEYTSKHTIRNPDDVKEYQPRFVMYPCKFDTISVLYNGDVTFCLAVKDNRYILGNIFQTDIKSIIDSHIYRNIKNMIHVNNRKVCKGCEYKYKCGGGCPAEALNIFNDLQAPSPHCPHFDVMALLGWNKK